MVIIPTIEALMADCGQWLAQLRSYREKFNLLRSKLYTIAAGKTNQDYLVEVEHYHNQFHIQLINIHDFKHTIKKHIAEIERHPNFGHKIPHYQLEQQLISLFNDLNKIETDFEVFVTLKN